MPFAHLEVGTRLYIAPEVQSRKRRGPRDHSKADMYSLGVSLLMSPVVHFIIFLDRFLRNELPIQYWGRTY